jgi:hypothetical protein
MHLQQTKRLSRETGGPQYYFHHLTDPVKTFLRKKGAVRVALVTPYGATKSDYFAVSTDSKLDAKQRPIRGNVGHDRIQQGLAAESIGESSDRKLDVVGTVGQMLNSAPTQVYGERLFNQVVMEAWRKSAISSLNISRDDFIKVIEHHGWHYDENRHYWVRNQDVGPTLWEM